MVATVAGIHLSGIHSARPAANTVPDGSLYSCTTHSLIYKSDYAGNSWSTWATLGASPSGSITASGYTQNTAKLLGRTTSSSGAIEEISVGSGLTLSAGSLSASGGGGVTHAVVGNNSIGASNLTMTDHRVYMTKVTLGADCLIADIEAHVKNPAGDLVTTLAVALLSDSGGSPLRVLASSPAGSANTDLLLESAASTPVYRWFGRPLAYWAAAGDYWLAVQSNGNPTTMAYDTGTGSDRYYSSGGIWLADAGFYSVTTGSDKYSIRANTLS